MFYGKNQPLMISAMRNFWNDNWKSFYDDLPLPAKELT